MRQLRYMSVFAKVVETGSISAAAESMQLSKSVVSQQLKLLEQELGLTLLKRTTRKQSLTAAGYDFFQQCQKINNIAEHAWKQAEDAKTIPQGKVKITAPNALMDTLVVPAIAEVMKKYPLLRPQLIVNDRKLNLVAEDIDLAIRVGGSKDCSLKQKRIGEFRDILCGHGSLIKQGVDESTPYIANSWQGTHITHHFLGKSNHTEFRIDREATCVSSSFNTCLSLIEKGVGIGLVPDFLFHRTSLKEAFPDHRLKMNPIYVLLPNHQHLPIAVKACLTSIEQQLDARA
ncbi:MAG: LysR family transcriptional regulator [Parashewanella sp.]